MMGGWTGLGMAGWGWLGWILMILFLVATVAFVVWALGNLFGARSPRGEETALEILKRRFAAGEISQAEFEQARMAILGIPQNPHKTTTGGN